MCRHGKLGKKWIMFFEAACLSGPEIANTLQGQNPYRSCCHQGVGLQKKMRFAPFTTRWWFQIFFIFTPIPGAMIQFDLLIFFKWVETQPPTRLSTF